MAQLARRLTRRGVAYAQQQRKRMSVTFDLGHFRVNRFYACMCKLESSRELKAFNKWKEVTADHGWQKEHAAALRILRGAAGEGVGGGRGKSTGRLKVGQDPAALAAAAAAVASSPCAFLRAALAAFFARGLCASTSTSSASSCAIHSR